MLWNDGVYIWDIQIDLYNPVMAVVNYICFCIFFCCCVMIYVIAELSPKKNKQIALLCIIILGILLGLHFFLYKGFNISLLVPPLDTFYFTKFFQVIQYITYILVIFLVIMTLFLVFLKFLNKKYERILMKTLIYLIIFLTIYYIIIPKFELL